MSVCKFFLEGRCRFGNNCRFEHPYEGNTDGKHTESNYYGNQKDRYHYSTSNQQSYQSSGRELNYQTGNKFGVLAESRFQNSQPERQESKMTSSTSIHEMAKQEVDLWIKGNQWLFSCFAPLKEGQNIPGLDDTSPEELRLQAYQASIEGTYKDYIARVRQMTQEAQQKQQALLNPNAELSSVLVRLARAGNSASTSSISPFVPTNISAAASNFSFAQAAQALQQPSGTTSFPKQASTAAASTFSFAQAGQNILKIPAPSTGFAAKPSIFGNVTNAQPTIPGFGKAQQPLSQPSIFGNTASTLVPTAVFGNVNPTSLTATAVPNNTANSDSNPATTGTTLNVYTPVITLTTEEKAQFSASRFTLGKIPLRPPPRELC